MVILDYSIYKSVFSAIVRRGFMQNMVYGPVIFKVAARKIFQKWFWFRYGNIGEFHYYVKNKAMIELPTVVVNFIERTSSVSFDFIKNIC